jgi:hypothetical protein
MIRKSDWQAVQDEMLAEDRLNLGEPPTDEELRAYSSGVLPPEEEERVRALLVAYPELARAMATPFPTDDTESLPEQEVSRQWRSFRAQVAASKESGQKASGGKVLQFWRASAALAAGLALVFGGLLWREMTRHDPHVLGDGQVLYADGARGGSRQPALVTPDADSMVLIVPLFNAGASQRYRLEIADKTHTLWRSDVLTRPADDAFRIELARGYLRPGTYHVVLYGADGAREQRLETYSLRVR